MIKGSATGYWSAVSEEQKDNAKVLRGSGAFILLK
jgi:hypothetical protein